MASLLVTWMFGLVISGFIGGQMGGLSVTGVAASKSRCGLKAIYNFGDSNSDTGGRSAAFGSVPPPNGQTFFGKPSGRVCDGRLIIDFIAEELGLPYLSAYLDSTGTSFRHGANFAVAGSSIRPGDDSPFHLEPQILQFIQFKSRSTALYNQLTKNADQKQKGLTKNGKKIPSCKSSLPRPEDFPKALYTFDIGQNDLNFMYHHTKEKEVRSLIPDMLNNFTSAVEQLYKEGARVFWIHNTGPIGCTPFIILDGRPKPKNVDQYGCVKPQNEVVKEFNKQLKDRVSKLRAKLVNSTITYVDVYKAKFSLVTNAKKLGFGDPMKFCCGSTYGGAHHVDCGEKATVKGTKVYGKSCDNPSKLISWDGVHYSEAANKLVAKLIVNGSLSDPPISVANACHRP